MAPNIGFVRDGDSQHHLRGPLPDVAWSSRSEQQTELSSSELRSCTTFREAPVPPTLQAAVQPRAASGPTHSTVNGCRQLGCTPKSTNRTVGSPSSVFVHMKLSAFHNRSSPTQVTGGCLLHCRSTSLHVTMHDAGFCQKL